jgi:ribosomal protein S18 acetylase RimI-like enzyme
LRLHWLTARRSGRLVASLPCVEVPHRIGPPTLRLLGDNEACPDYLGVDCLVDNPTGHEGRASKVGVDPAVRAFADHLARLPDVQLRGLGIDEPATRALATRLVDHGGHLRVEAPCPFLDLAREPRDFETWLRARPGGLWAQLSRRRRWLAGRPGFRIERAEDETAVERTLPALFALHDARWQESGASRFVAPRSMAFQREAALALARAGAVRLYVLHADGAPRAALYGFRSSRRFAFYQSGTDPAYRARSVGTVLLCAALEDAFHEGRDEFDFLRGDEPYKRRFANAQRLVYRVTGPPSTWTRVRRWMEVVQRMARPPFPGTPSSSTPRTNADADCAADATRSVQRGGPHATP